MVPHLEHTEPTIVVLAGGGYMRLLISRHKKRKILSHSLFSLSEMRFYMTSDIELTFAGFDAFRPLVTDVSVGDTSTVLIPSTARSATTASARFLERAALWTSHGISDHCGDCWVAD